MQGWTTSHTETWVASSVEAIERARRAGIIAPGSAGARWTSVALRERLEETLDVDTSHVHAPDAPAGRLLRNAIGIDSDVLGARASALP